MHYSRKTELLPGKLPVAKKTITHPETLESPQAPHPSHDDANGARCSCQRSAQFCRQRYRRFRPLNKQIKRIAAIGRITHY
jgi:hypothetical protein